VLNHAIRLGTHTLAAAAAAALLAACGGGGDPDPLVDADAGVDAADAALDEREAALAVVMPPLRAAPAGLAGNVRCTNWRIGAVTVDNLVVPAGSSCRLAGTIVTGSIQVAPGAVLLANGIQVTGNVQGDDAAHVQVTGSATRIGGNFQLEGGGSGTLTGARVRGDVFFNGLNDVIRSRNNVVGGNLQVTDNRGGGEIVGNRIDGNLQCTGNAPAPLASANTAASIEDQCAPGGDGSPTPGTPPGTPPLTGNVTCNGLTLGAIRLDTVVVPDGATCALVGTRLNGNLEVGAGARVTADGIAVNGGVIADGATELRIGGVSRVGGSVQVQRGGGATIVGAGILGNLQIDAMQGPVAAAGNLIGGNLQAMANQGGVTLTANRIDGNLQCKGNQPAPTGRGNTATLKEDQCQRL
jgi:hypothetical protein